MSPDANQSRDRENSLAFTELPDLRLEYSGSARLERIEPDDYCLEHHCKILVSDPRDDGAELDVGELDVIHAQFGLAVNNGVSWIDVLDAHSEGASEYCSLLENNSTWKDDVGDVGNLDLLILERCIVRPEFRGHGLGLLAAKCAIDAFGESCGVVAVIPFPLEFAGFEDPNWVPPAGVSAENKKQAFSAAKTKLEMYWSRLGLTPYNERIWILLTAHVSPSAAEIFRGLQAPVATQVPPPRRTRHRHGSGWKRDTQR